MGSTKVKFNCSTFSNRNAMIKISQIVMDVRGLNLVGKLAKLMIEVCSTLFQLWSQSVPQLPQRGLIISYSLTRICGKKWIYYGS